MLWLRLGGANVDNAWWNSSMKYGMDVISSSMSNCRYCSDSSDYSEQLSVVLSFFLWYGFMLEAFYLEGSASSFMNVSAVFLIQWTEMHLEVCAT